MNNMLSFLKNKWLLVDTNFLINFAENSDSFRGFIDTLQSLNVYLVIDRSIEFEFLRSANRRLELEKRILLLEKLLGTDRIFLRYQDELFEDAKTLANLYSKINGQYNKQISFQDCLIAAHLRKYKNNLYLATLDLQDFPLEVFDRVQVICIDVGKSVLTIGFYAYNETKYDELVRKYSEN